MNLKWQILGKFLIFLSYREDIIAKKFIGHYCEISYNHIGDKKSAITSAITGEILKLTDAGFIIIENQEGVHYLDTRTIITIKPQDRRVGE